jgi:hypothetical protein
MPVPMQCQCQYAKANTIQYNTIQYNTMPMLWTMQYIVNAKDNAMPMLRTMQYNANMPRLIQCQYTKANTMPMLRTMQYNAKANTIQFKCQGQCNANANAMQQSNANANMPRLIKYNANAKDNAKAFYSFSLPQS